MFSLTAPARQNKFPIASANNLGKWLLLLLGILLVVRITILYFSPTDLFFDEAQYWSWSEDLAFGYYSKPPLIAWLIGLSTSICGSTEFCIRLPSPIINMGTSLLVYWLGQRVYSTQIGFWSALTFATMPGVTISSSLISTDVPLLFFWALALLAFANMVQLGGASDTHSADAPARPVKRSWGPAVLLGLALGLGLNAKYAMAFFIMCAGLYIFVTPSRWWLLRDPRLYFAAVLGALLLVPNALWNFEHGFATLTHTADNANWSDLSLHPLKALEFIGAQFGVFGPILCIGLITIIWRAWFEGLNDADRFMTAFVLPVLIVIAAQALLSRAHANWAATAYVAATVLVVATLIRRREWHWLKGSLAAHIMGAILFGIGTMLAGRIDYPGDRSPFERVLGWSELAKTTRQILKTAPDTGAPIAAILTNDRAISAELLYYLRDDPIPLYAWRITNRAPQHHYQLTRPFVGTPSSNIMLVTKTTIHPHITRHFKQYKLVAQRLIPAGYGKPRTIRFYFLTGYSPPIAKPRKS